MRHLIIKKIYLAHVVHQGTEWTRWTVVDSGGRDLPVCPKISLQTSAMVGYDYYYAPTLDQKNDGINWDVSLSANVFLWKGAMAYASADAGGGEITLQRTYHGVDYEYSLGLRQGFLQNRLILSVSAIMPFQNRYAGPVRDTYTETYYQHNEGWYNPRQFRLGLTWRFGKTSINFKHARKTEVSDKL